MVDHEPVTERNADPTASPPEGPLPAFDRANRRAFLKGVGTLGAAMLVPALAACGNDDADTLADSGSSTAESTTTSSTAPTTAAPSTTAPATDGDTGTGTSLPAGAQLTVDFTYTSESGGGGPSHNPYIAVWVESAAGDLVANLSLWYNPPKGDRWVNQLSSWYAADTAFVEANGDDGLDAVTGATRPAGSYSVVWDATTASGDRATAGDYVILVESAREHGPHSLTSATMTLGDSGATAPLPDDGELNAASATFTV